MSDTTDTLPKLHRWVRVDTGRRMAVRCGRCAFAVVDDLLDPYGADLVTMDILAAAQGREECDGDF